MAKLNVGLAFAQRIADGLAQGVWNSHVLSNYVSVLMGPDANALVGIAHAIQGSIAAATAIPASCLSQRVVRLRCMSLLSLLAMAATSYALLLPDVPGSVPMTKYSWLCGGLALWGMVRGDMRTCCEEACCCT